MILFGRRNYVLSVCFFALFAGFSVRYSYGLLLPQMLPALSISKAEAGVIFSSFFIAYTAFSPIVGVLADEISIRKVLVIFLIILGCGSTLMAFASSLKLAILFFGLAGIGASGCWPPVMSLAQRWIGDARKGMVLAVITSGGAFGTMVSSLVMPILVEKYSWRSGWIFLGALGFSLAFVCAIVVVDRPDNKEVNIQSENMESNKGNRFSVREAFIGRFRDSKFWLIGGSYMLVVFSILIPFTFLATYAVQEFGLPYKDAARLISIIAIASIIGRFLLSSLSDYLSRIKVLIFSCILIAFGILGMIYQQSYNQLRLFVFIFGCGHGSLWPLYAACASDYFPKNYTGSILGAWTLLGGICSIACPVIVGYLVDYTGTFAWSFILGAVVAATSIMLLFPLVFRSEFSLTNSAKS
jgi:sugar phosphate permease